MDKLLVILLILLVLIIIGLVIFFVVRKTKSNYMSIGADSGKRPGNPDDPIKLTKPNKNGFVFWTNFHDCSCNPTAPGGDPFDPNNASIDSDGNLKLSLVNKNGNWTAAEAVLFSNGLDYGDYWFTIDFSNMSGGAKYYNQNPNTVVGVFTYSLNESKTSGQGFCWPNNVCNELDMIEWGKSGHSDNTGPGDWGVQPWYLCTNPIKNVGDTCQCPNPDDPSSCLQGLNTSNIKRLDDHDKSWDPSKTGNKVTFHINWPSPKDTSELNVISFSANPGDFGPEPWNGGFPVRDPLWRWSGWPDGSTSAERQMNWPTINNDQGDIHKARGPVLLHFNLWTQGHPPDGKSQSVTISNMAFPKKVQDDAINAAKSNPMSLKNACGTTTWDCGADGPPSVDFKCSCMTATSHGKYYECVNVDHTKYTDCKDYSTKSGVECLFDSKC